MNTMHVRTANNRIKATQHGFSLVEVLVALIIMSVGMLGVAGLYVQSMQAGRTSMLRHNAVTLAGDVADRIRSNPRAGAAYTDADGADHGCVAGDADCDEIEMAEHDIMLWQTQADDTMPNGLVTITFDDTVVPPDYTIAITWDEPGEVMDYTVTIPVFGI
jgi:type IV pilus assembly protein PilV